jgi:phosphohistidine phosphatase
MPVRTLILARHAKFDWSGMESDIHRPLAARGRRQAPEAGRWLDTNIDHIDQAMVSPATRAQQTWDLVAAQLRTKPPTTIDYRVYGPSERQRVSIVTNCPPNSTQGSSSATTPAWKTLSSPSRARRRRCPPPASPL